jgi:hypothetical protein
MSEKTLHVNIGGLDKLLHDIAALSTGNSVLAPIAVYPTTSNLIEVKINEWVYKSLLVADLETRYQQDT